MRKNKGISLIVLIITIIVIIILATAILVSVISNNPISEANKARYESDRDNIQAVFTNTVGKIMAENQGVANVTAGQINNETKDVSEATGAVAYTVDNAANEANASGTIVFDKGTNTATTYYTGKKLPIYAAGETKWYVDSDGVISLEVAGEKYGSGEVVSGTEEETLAAGLYAEDGTFTPWQTLLDNGDLVVENGALRGSIAIGEYNSVTVYKTNIIGKLVIDNSVTEIQQYAFGYYADSSTGLKEIIIPGSVQVIKNGAFWNCPLENIIILDGVKEIESYAFRSTSFNHIYIPSSVSVVGYSIFDLASTQTIYCEVIEKPEEWDENFHDRNGTSSYIDVVYNVTRAEYEALIAE